MKRNVKKVVSAVVVSSMLLSMAACSNKANQEVIDAADDFASAIVKRDEKKIYKATNIDEKKQDSSMFVYADDFDGKAIKEAILDEMEAEVQEDTVEVSTKDHEASIDVVFSLPKYEDVFDETEASDEDELIAEIKKADKEEITVTIEFEQDGDDWVVTNAQKVLDKVFGDVYTVTVPSFVDLSALSFYWYGEEESDGAEAWYLNTTWIDVDLEGCDNVASVHYEVEYKGEVVYKSDNGDIMGYYTEDEGAEVDEFGFLLPGDYTITFYVGNVALAPCVAHVETNMDDLELDWYGPYDDYDGNEAWYEDAAYINVTAWGLSDIDEVYYTVKHDGKLVYTSEEGEYDAYFGNEGEEDYGNYTDANGLLPAGDYVIEFHIDSADYVFEAVAHVENSGSGDALEGIADPMLEFVDSDFESKVVFAAWYNPDKDLSLVDSFTYESGVSKVSYWLEVPEGTTDPIYYAYFYVEDANEDFDLDSAPIFEGEVTPTSYNQAYCYDIDCNQGDDGAYLLVVGNNKNFDEVYFTTACIVGAVG